MEREGSVQVRVLGPVRVDDNGVDVALTPQLRRLLGLLVVADGAVVSADRLAEYVAEGRTEGSTVRTAVSRLRKVLGDRIESVDGGYRLVLGADELDVARFEQLLGRSKQAPTEARCSSLATALDLWSGQPLGDLADEEWATAWSARLDGLRVGAMEDLADDLIGAGRHREAIELLEAVVAEQPYRERPIASLMRALREDGRVADALRGFERFRVTLRDDTGLEPSRVLRDLESELLSVEGARDGPGAAEPQLPTGTVTFLFTDIEGSTQRWADDETAMTAALAAHDAVLREVVAEHGGLVFKHTGDGVCAVFASASSAVGAAVVAQECIQLPVRMGIHTGEAELRDGDYFGPTLNRVARIMDAGHGRQVLISSATAALVRDVEVADLGDHQLKGLSSPERILQVGTAEFPGLRVASARKGNLPIEPTEFVGRHDEMADIVDRLNEQQMLTLLGVGGAGKTRLATEAGHLVAPRFPDGCWLVELARVVVPEAVPHAICIGLGLEVPERGDVVDHVLQRLRHQRLLVVIDNCEHVLEAAAEVVEAILAACPTVTILATSREPLMVAGEHLVPIPSLADADAIALFLDRVGAEAPTLVLDERQSAAIAAICRRLDGLPLAIELAASRARTMSPVEIEERLDERFRLLVGGRRSRMERHQTMRGTVDWSYDSCTDAERHVFDRLSVFAGGFDLNTACEAAVDDDHDQYSVEDAVARLVDRSLIQRIVRPDGGTRFRLLETMRAYGHERLVAAGRADEARNRHAEILSDALARLSLISYGPDEKRVKEQVRELAADLLLAVDWCVEHGEWRRIARICNGALMSSDMGLGNDLLRRVAPQLPPPWVPVDGLPPLVHLGLWYYTRVSGLASFSSALDHETSHRLLDLLRAGETVPFDAVHLAPFAYDGSGSADMWNAAEQFLRRLQSAPAVLRWYMTFGALQAASRSNVDDLDRVLADFEALTSTLESERATSCYHAQLALILEMRGSIDAAHEHVRQALVTGPAGWGDILVACRAVRIAAQRFGRISGEDLRRPIEWQRQVCSGDFAVAPLASSAFALKVTGFDELARRVVGALAPDERDVYARVFDLPGRPEVPALFLEPELPDTDADEVAAEILALADELDRREGLL